MRSKMLLLIASLAVATISANGAAAQTHANDLRLLQLAPDSKGSLAIEVPNTFDFARPSETKGDEQVVQAGFWSSVKKAAKGVASTAKKVAGTAKTVVKKGVDAAKKVGSTVKGGVKGVINVAKKVVKTAVSPITKSPVATVAKKLAQKIGTKIGKTIAKRL